MRRMEVRRGLFALLAVCAWFGVIGQVAMAVQSAVATGGNALGAALTVMSYWTLLSNLFVALACTAALLAPGSRAGRFFGRPIVRLSIGIYIATTGLIYFGLLRGMWQPQGFQKVLDTVLHYVTPLLAVAACFVVDPPRPIAWRDLPKILIFPLAYLVYALVRGAATGTYFYPFLDAGALGLGQVLINSAVLSVAFLAAGAAVVALGRRADWWG